MDGFVPGSRVEFPTASLDTCLQKPPLVQMEHQLHRHESQRYPKIFHRGWGDLIKIAHLGRMPGVDFFEELRYSSFCSWMMKHVLFRLIVGLLWDVVFPFLVCILLVVGFSLHPSEFQIGPLLGRHMIWDSTRKAWMVSSCSTWLWHGVGFGWCETLRGAGVPHSRMDILGTPHAGYCTWDISVTNGPQ